MPIAQVIRALASERRLQVLDWLKDPVAHFPPQVDAEKLGVSQPTVSEHLKILSQSGLVSSKRIKQWTFYKRDEVRIGEVKQEILKTI
jgi:DNA-binding transcriptional ArsR family regulator